MAKVKVINSGNDSLVFKSDFDNIPSNVLYKFGSFNVTTNFDGRVEIDYTKRLGSFSNQITLNSLNITQKQSELLNSVNNDVVLNLDKSNLNTFVRYGSAYEFIRLSIQNIKNNYVGSLFINSRISRNSSSITYVGLSYDESTNRTIFYVPTNSIVNSFGIKYNEVDSIIDDDNEILDLTLYYNKYVIWSKTNNNHFKILGYTGNTINNSGNYSGTSIPLNDYIRLEVYGNPFDSLDDSGIKDFHIRPNSLAFEEFRAKLGSYEQNIISKRENNKGFTFTIREPKLLDNGEIIYSSVKLLWSTIDGYNLDIESLLYERFSDSFLSIGLKYDKIKTNLISRFLTPTSLHIYDTTSEGKIGKLLKLYGREFDQIRQFIDSLVNINHVSYDKINNIPDRLVKNMANTFGWNSYSLINEENLMDGFLTIDDVERDLNKETLPSEINIELWRRILINTNYFWKSKGTRESIMSMFLLIGIPEEFINITEYVYTVEGRIDPNSVELSVNGFPSKSLPYDNDGYPIAPLETSSFYFQANGESDDGQTYMNVFRDAGFKLNPVIDNKKTWIQQGEVVRKHPTMPQYYQEDSRLVLNTKEIDISLDVAKGIESDVFYYIQKDYKANNSSYILPYAYVNVMLPVNGNMDTFTLPYGEGEINGDFEVRCNGILLSAPTINGVDDLDDADYVVNGNQITLLNGNSISDNIQVSLISNSTTTPIQDIVVNYVNTRVNVSSNGNVAEILLPTTPKGNIQLTVNGIALTPNHSGIGSPDYYILDNKIQIYNSVIIDYLSINPIFQVSYVEVTGTDLVNFRNEVIVVNGK